MQKILLLGGGLSTTSFIKYILDNAEKYDWKLRIGDQQLAPIKKQLANHPRGECFDFDVTNQEQLYHEVSEADIVVSMLPARFHHFVARAAVELGKNMVTASYVSEDIKELD